MFWVFFLQLLHQIQNFKNGMNTNTIWECMTKSTFLVFFASNLVVWNNFFFHKKHQNPNKIATIQKINNSTSSCFLNNIPESFSVWNKHFKETEKKLKLKTHFFFKNEHILPTDAPGRIFSENIHSGLVSIIDIRCVFYDFLTHPNPLILKI